MVQMELHAGGNRGGGAEKQLIDLEWPYARVLSRIRNLRGKPSSLNAGCSCGRL